MIKVSMFVLSILICSLFTGLFITENAKADVAPVPPEAGFGTNITYNTYLKNVDVEIDLYKEYANGHGEFTLSNPSNSSEFLELYFDPGVDSIQTNVTINDEKITTKKQFIDYEHFEFYNGHSDKPEVTVFNCSISSYSSLIINIDWVMDVKTVYTHFDTQTGDVESKTTSWTVNYLIIGPSTCDNELTPCIESWNRSIDNVCVSFDVHCEEFKDYSTNIDMENSTNSEGYPILTYCCNNFSEPYLRLTIEGIRSSTKPNLGDDNIPGFELIFVISAAIVVYFIRRKKQMK